MPSPSLSKQLLQQAEEFCGERGISLRQLGVAVMNDPGFFTRIRNGGGFTATTFERFQAYFAAHGAQRPDETDAA